jgi:hypothetical protein
MDEAFSTGWRRLAAIGLCAIAGVLLAMELWFLVEVLRSPQTDRVGLAVVIVIVIGVVLGLIALLATAMAGARAAQAFSGRARLWAAGLWVVAALALALCWFGVAVAAYGD